MDTGTCFERVFSWRGDCKYLYNGRCPASSYSLGTTAWTSLAGLVILLCYSFSGPIRFSWMIYSPCLAFALCRPTLFIPQDLMLKACGNLSVFIWNHELLPLDILLLALIDRDDDPNALRIVVCSLWSFSISFLSLFILVSW